MGRRKGGRREKESELKPSWEYQCSTALEVEAKLDFSTTRTNTFLFSMMPVCIQVLRFANEHGLMGTKYKGVHGTVVLVAALRHYLNAHHSTPLT